MREDEGLSTVSPALGDERTLNYRHHNIDLNPRACKIVSYYYNICPRRSLNYMRGGPLFGVYIVLMYFYEYYPGIDPCTQVISHNICSLSINYRQTGLY